MAVILNAFCHSERKRRISCQYPRLLGEILREAQDDGEVELNLECTGETTPLKVEKLITFKTE